MYLVQENVILLWQTLLFEKVKFFQNRSIILSNDEVLPFLGHGKFGRNCLLRTNIMFGEFENLISLSLWANSA